MSVKGQNCLRSRHLSLQAGMILLLLLLAACEQNRFKNGEQLYNQKRYAAAVEQLDRYIKTGNNGAYVTRAELVRSASYYELGTAASGKENWNLAIRLLKLANSDQADLELAKVYRVLALEAIEQNDIPKAMSYFDLIMDETSNSDLIPEIHKLRIEQYLDFYKDEPAAWKEYMLLYDKYPEHAQEVEARIMIESFIASNIDAAVVKAINKDYNTALEELFEIRRYPVGNRDRIDLEISNIYQEQAENEITRQEYSEANFLFLKALQYYPQKKDAIDKRLVLIAGLYVDKGNDFLRVRDFSSAMLYYQKSYEIIPDFETANIAVENLNRIRSNIATAAKLYEEAQQYEQDRNYPEARKLYSQAYALDNVSVYNEQAIIMGNLIEAERNPLGFARSIITNYRNGLLYNRIQAQKQQLLKKYTQEEIKDTGWKILLSTGQFKYEARYDLLTPGENYYYVWQINLKDRSVVPLNKISDQLMQ